MKLTLAIAALLASVTTIAIAAEGTDNKPTLPAKYNKADPNLKHGKDRPKYKTEAKSGAPALRGSIEDVDNNKARYIEDMSLSRKANDYEAPKCARGAGKCPE